DLDDLAVGFDLRCRHGRLLRRFSEHRAIVENDGHAVLKNRHASRALGETMWFQRITAGLLLLAIAGLAAVSYFSFRTNSQLQTLKSFVEGYVFADAVAAFARASKASPFQMKRGNNTPEI